MAVVQCQDAWLPQAAALGQLSDSDIVAGLRALPMESRILIYLTDVKGLAYEETAEITGAPAEAVAAWLYQARCQLGQRAACAAASCLLPAGSRRVRGGARRSFTRRERFLNRFITSCTAGWCLRSLGQEHSAGPDPGRVGSGEQDGAR